MNNSVDYINQNNKAGNRPYINNNNLQPLTINNIKQLTPKVKCTCSKTGCKKNLLHNVFGMILKLQL